MSSRNQIIGYGGSVSSGSSMVGEARFVELDGNFCFFLFRLEVGQQLLQYGDAFGASYLRDKQIPMLVWVAEMPRGIGIEEQVKRITQKTNRARVSHFNTQTKNVGVCAMPSSRCGSLNGDATFSVDQTSAVRKCGFVHNENEDSTNSASFQESEQFGAHEGCPAATHEPCPKIRTPAWLKAMGHVKPSLINGEHLRSQEYGNPQQAMRKHVQLQRLSEKAAAKRKRQSDLMGNYERRAEMTRPLSHERGNRVQILWMGALGVNNRRKNGVLGNITQSITS